MARVKQKTAKASAKAPARAKQRPLNADNTYISNPFSVVALSFKAVLSLNIATMVGLISLMLGSVLLTAIAGTTLLASAGPQRGALLGLALLVLVVVWLLILSVAFTHYALATSRHQLVSLGQTLRVGYKKAAGFLGLTVLISLIVLVGLVLLVVPGLIFMYWYLLAPFVYIDQEVSIREAMSISRKLARGQSAELFGLIAATSIFAIPGMVPIIGVLYQVFYNAAASVAFAYRYESAAALGNKRKPPTHPANYWAIVAALALYALIIVGAGVTDWKTI